MRARLVVLISVFFVGSVPSAIAQPDSMDALRCQLDNYFISVEGARRDGTYLTRRARQQHGQLIHQRRVAVWRSFAQQGFLRDRGGRTFLGDTGQGVYRFNDSDNFEIWLEKGFVDPQTGKTFRADSVFVDLQTGHAVVTDPTARSLNDPLWRTYGIYERSEGASAEHFIKDSEQKAALSRFLQSRSPRTPPWTVDIDTSEGIYYATFRERVRRQQNEHASRQLRSFKNRDDGQRGARGFLGVLLIGMMIDSFVMPAEARAAEDAANARAQRTLDGMLKAYIEGDPRRFAELRRSWDGLPEDPAHVSGDGMQYVRNLGPLPDSVQLGFLFGIGAMLDQFEKSMEPLRRCIEQCERAIAADYREIAKREEVIQRAAEALIRRQRETYAELSNRLERRVSELQALERHASGANKTLDWSGLPAFVASRNEMEKGLAAQQQGDERELRSITLSSGSTAAYEWRFRRNLSRALYGYWRFSSQTVAWQKNGLVEDYRAEVAAIKAEFDRQWTAFSAGKPTLEEKRAFASRFAERERRNLERFAVRHREIYERLAGETFELAAVMSAISGGDFYVVHLVKDITLAEMGRLFSAMLGAAYFNSEPIHYPELGPLATRATINADEAFARARPGAQPLREGELSQLQFWVNGVPVDLAKNRIIREGSRLRGLATPDSPPPAHGFGSWPVRWVTIGTGLTWKLTTGVPSEGRGPMFETDLPLVATDTAAMLDVRTDGGEQKRFPLQILPNRRPALCLSLPKSVRAGEPARLTWALSDADPHDSVSVTIETNGAPPRLHGGGIASVRGEQHVRWPASGKQRVRATSFDGLVLVTQEWAIDVVENHPPRMMGLTADGDVRVRQPFEVHARARDSDAGDKLFFRTRLPAGMDVVEDETCKDEPQGFSCRMMLRATRTGDFVLRVTVTDLSDATDSLTIPVRVR